MNLQPFQEADLENARQGELPVNALKTVAGIGASVAGGKAISKILPFLSNLIPQDLAIKGLSKVDPRMGRFINKAMGSGQTAEDVLSYIKNKLNPEEQKQLPSPQQQNIIAQYDDQLHAFIEDQINQGRAPLEAGAIARSSGKFNKAITQMEKDHKANFSSIIESVYGQQEQQQQPMQQAQQMSQQQGQGPGAQALMALADKLSKM